MAYQWEPRPAGRSTMTLRERWLRQMHFEKVDRIPNMEFGYWDETLPRWHTEGLPKSVDTEAKAYAYFGIEDWQCAPINAGLHPPPFQDETLEETESYIVVRERDGSVYKQNKGTIKTIPHYIEFGLKDRQTWQRYKAALDPNAPGRYPDNWDQLVRAYQERDYPLAVPIYSMIGRPRNWMGFEGLAYMVHDDPQLVDEIVQTVADCVVGTIERALNEVEFDFGAGWEDICFRSGPIVSPAMFDRWIVPRYKRVTDLLHDHGIDVIWTDCDGDIKPIIPQFLAGGINCMFPLEVAAGSDPVEIRKRFGTAVLLHGGVDKRALARSLKDVEKEVHRLKPLVEQGGFVPHVDHRCPVDVPLANYKYYMKLKREVLGAGDLLPHYDE